MTDFIKTSVEGRLGCLTLDRPRALNALSLEMIRSLTDTLTRWRSDPDIDAVLIRSSMGRAFCAGGDIRWFHERAIATPRSGSAELEDFFTEEYALNHLVHHYPKPYVALMDGVVMGGGMGIAQCGPAHRMRIVTERTRMAMPEVNIGLFPDVGGSHFLSRARGRTGWYLGLTGQIIGGADAVHAGLADRLVPFALHAGLVEALSRLTSQEWRDGAWRGVVSDVAIDAAATANDTATAADPGAPASLASCQEAIDHHFSKPGVAAIMASLENDSSAFAQATLESMRKRSPLSQCVTYEQLQRGAGLTMADCLRMERGMVRRCFEHGDVAEGIRAAVIDKDAAPRWDPATLDAVDPVLVQRYFETPWPAHAHPLRWLQEGIAG